MAPKSQQELRNSVASNDRRFRWAQATFMAVVILFLVGISLLEYSIIERQQKNAHARQDQIISLQSQIQKKVDEQNKMIECIANFFTETNRQDKVITNVNQCSVTMATAAAVSAQPTQPHFKPTQTISKSSPPPANPTPAPKKPQSFLDQILGALGL